jgi:hypothetical protein
MAPRALPIGFLVAALCACDRAVPASPADAVGHEPTSEPRAERQPPPAPPPPPSLPCQAREALARLDGEPRRVYRLVAHGRYDDRRRRAHVDWQIDDGPCRIFGYGLEVDVEPPGSELDLGAPGVASWPHWFDQPKPGCLPAVAGSAPAGTASGRVQIGDGEWPTICLTVAIEDESGWRARRIELAGSVAVEPP